ncbi:MAG: adenylyl-sulfate kinase [Gammaproteobacteria bacterium]|nr:adenylyl-sulfate kinase [Gammaproteobacteria bacterium]
MQSDPFDKTGRSNTRWQQSLLSREVRESRNRHRAAVLWFTGLSGAGKSTLAHATEKRLFELSCQTYVLDGDNVRHGLCGDLGFSVEDRSENLRRIGHVAKLFFDTGVIILSAFISPFSQDRAFVRRMIPAGRFIEIYCSTPLEVCESRDTKGLYLKARAGLIKDFTGVSAAYEPPTDPELIIDTQQQTIAASVEEIVVLLVKRNILQL